MAACTFFCACTVKEKPQKKGSYTEYSNPIEIIQNDGSTRFTTVSDPYCIRGDDGFYYLYSTNCNCERGDRGWGFDYLPIFKSRDLANWEYAGSPFITAEEKDVILWGDTGNGEGLQVWAPTVLKIGDTYNLYYTVTDRWCTDAGIGVATSPTPYGPWTHHGKLFLGSEIGVEHSIDPHVFIDEKTEAVYMVWGSGFGIWLVELSPDGLDLYGGMDFARENKVWIAAYKVFEDSNYEAAFILQKDGKYYLFLSTGSCINGRWSEYHVVVSVADNVYGPYKDTAGNDMKGPNMGDLVVEGEAGKTAGVGHMCVVNDDKGEYFMVYHGYDVEGQHPDERTLYVDKLLFDEKTGMPYVKDFHASNHVKVTGAYIYD